MQSPPAASHRAQGAAAAVAVRAARSLAGGARPARAVGAVRALSRAMISWRLSAKRWRPPSESNPPTHRPRAHACAQERKVAILLYGFPPGVGATGTAALLQVPR